MKPDGEEVSTIVKLQSLNFLYAERFATLSLEADSMRRLLRSEGIVYADTKIGRDWNLDDDKVTVNQIRKITGRRLLK